MRNSAVFKSILCLSFLWTFLVSAQVRPNNILVTQGQGFQMRLIRSQNSSAHWKSCTLNLKLKQYPLNTTYILPTGELVQPMDTESGETECGVRVFNASMDSEGFWELYAANDDSSVDKGISAVRVMDMVKSQCAVDKYECNSNDANFHSRKCGADHCDYWVNGKMDKSSMRIEQDRSPTMEIKEPLSLKSGGKVLECKSDSIVDCFVDHVPTGARYLVQDGLQHVRYSAHRSDFKHGICQFDIPNGVNESEAGLWRMTVYNRGENPVTTCDFYLASNKSAENLRRRIQSIVQVKTIKDQVEIECIKSSYYPLQLCYLIKSELEFNHTLDDGSCTFTVSPGNWTCGFNGPTEEENDLEQRFEVIKYEHETIDAVVKVTNTSTSVECHLYNQEPIRLCMIKSPSGKTYRPPTDKFKSKEFSFYSGAGRMATGDCGIEFNGIQVESGYWECIIGKQSGEILPPIGITVPSNEVHGDSSA